MEHLGARGRPVRLAVAGASARRLCHQRGVRGIVGTPTYAVPPWLARRYPEIAGEAETGVRKPWGARQEIDYTHPAFKFYAERIIRKIVSRYANHPAVIGYQVDNSPA